MNARIAWEAGWRVAAGFLWNSARLPAYLVFFFLPLSFILGLNYAGTSPDLGTFDFAILTIIPLIAVLMVALPLAIFNGVVVGVWLAVRGKTEIKTLQYLALAANSMGAAVFVGSVMIANSIPVMSIFAGMVIWAAIGFFIGIPANLWIKDNEELLDALVTKRKNETSPRADWDASHLNWRDVLPFLQNEINTEN